MVDDGCFLSVVRCVFFVGCSCVCVLLFCVGLSCVVCVFVVCCLWFGVVAWFEFCVVCCVLSVVVGG